jgi:hypothetical protein
MLSREMKRTTNKILQSRRRRRGAKQRRKADEKGSKGCTAGKEKVQCNIERFQSREERV